MANGINTMDGLPTLLQACVREKKPQLSPLRSTGIPVELSGAYEALAVFLERKPHT